MFEAKLKFNHPVNNISVLSDRLPEPAEFKY